MNEKEAIQFLIHALEEIPRLRELPHDNEDFKLWESKVMAVLQKALDEDDFITFAEAFPRSIPMRGLATQESLHDHYQHKITLRETALKKILQQYEIFGIEEEPAPAGEPTDIDELPIHLFDKMQFHPDIVIASKSLFESGHYAQAVLEAFKAVNNCVKEMTGLPLDGKALMSKAFSEQKPLIKLNKLSTQSERDEQEGFKFLFMGAMVGIRNPLAHEARPITEPHRALEYLGLASLLMGKIETAEE